MKIFRKKLLHKVEYYKKEEIKNQNLYYQLKTFEIPDLWTHQTNKL